MYYVLDVIMDNIENEEPIESGEIIQNDDVGIQDQEGEKTNEENGEDNSKESEKREGTQEKMQSEKRSESQKKESNKSQNSKKSRVIELDNREEVDRESGKSKGKETAKYEDQDEKQLEFVNDEIPIVENKTNMSLEGKMKDNHSFGIMPENIIQSKKNDNQITAQDSAIQQVLNLNETKNYLVDKKNDNPFFEDESPKKNKQKSSLEPSDNPRKRIQSAFPQSNVQESGRLGKLKIERDRKKLNDPPEGETILVNHDQHNDSGKQAAPSKSGHIDLFLRKNKLTRAPIDHDQIKMHAITTKASMIEAELAREEKRKKFVD